MIRELFHNLFKTKTTTLNVVIVIVICTFCFSYIVLNIASVAGNTISPEVLLRKEDILKEILLIGLGALVKSGYDIIKQQ